MEGLILDAKEFLSCSKQELVTKLRSIYPSADPGQVQSWETIIDDLKNCSQFITLAERLTIAIEYSLPTDGMAIDLIFAGIDDNSAKTAVIVECKQWNNQYIVDSSFSAYREDGKELHPQIQVSRHKLSFKDYLDIGSQFNVVPVVYIRNCSSNMVNYLSANNPRPVTTPIPIFVSVFELISFVDSIIKAKDDSIRALLLSAEYTPSKEIIKAMGAIATKEEPFILTKEQVSVVSKVKSAIGSGKKIIRIVGAAGSGKTAILLNLYVEYLNLMASTGCRPIFVSGAQNTALYQSLYPEVERSFTYSFSLDRMVAKTKGNLYYLFMDEAQHNQEGIITNMVNRGATIVLCYDTTQIINADNSIAELKRLEERDDFETIELINSVRYNGSSVAEKNIRTYLKGKRDFIPDELYEFGFFDDYSLFQEKIKSVINTHPDSTVAVTGLLSFDSVDYTVDKNPKSILFTKWGNKTECEWIPYIREKGYLSKNDGRIWVGTWWMPGLDVDYVFVIVGGDASMTTNGVVANPEQAKHYRMMVSIAQNLGFPKELIKEKKVFGKITTDFFNSSKQIIKYINQKGNEDKKDAFISLFSKLIRNNYYIMMTRGCKGCFVYFTDNEVDKG